MTLTRVPDRMLGAGNRFHISKYSDLTAAIAAIGSTVGTLVLDSPTTITGATTVPNTLTLLAMPGGLISGPYTLTIYNLDAPLMTVFDTDVIVTGLKHSNVRHFGALGDLVHDDSNAINAAMAAATHSTRFPAGEYKAGDISINNKDNFVMVGPEATIYNNIASKHMFVMDDGNTCRGLTMNFYELETAGSAYDMLSLQQGTLADFVFNVNFVKISTTGYRFITNEYGAVVADRTAGLFFARFNIGRIDVTVNNTVGDIIDWQAETNTCSVVVFDITDCRHFGAGRFANFESTSAEGSSHNQIVFQNIGIESTIHGFIRMKGCAMSGLKNSIFYDMHTKDKFDITAITKANPAVVTFAATHNYANGDDIVITAVEGMTEINGGPYTVANVTASTVELVGVDSTGYTNYTADTGHAYRAIDGNLIVLSDGTFGCSCEGSFVKDVYRSGGKLGTGYVDIKIDSNDIMLENIGSRTTGPVFTVNTGGKKIVVVNHQYVTFTNLDLAHATIIHKEEGIRTPRLAVGPSEPLTISGGAITVTGTYHNVEVESGSADDLTAIYGGVAGQILVLECATVGNVVTCKDNTGNLRLAGDFPLGHTQDTITLILAGSNWKEISRSDNEV